jgi:hypothetical protein
MAQKLNTKCRQALLEALETHLDTRDKRFMFLKINFKQVLPNINLEGSPRDASWNIYNEFEKQQMLGSLMACLNVQFDCDLLLELKL